MSLLSNTIESANRHLAAIARLSPLTKGSLLGLAAVLIWGAFFAISRSGVIAGVSPLDMAFFRGATAGAVMLPWLLRNGFSDLAGVGWPRGLILMLLAGSPFVFVGTAGYLFAPLAHGAVIQPASIVVMGSVLAMLVLGEKPDRARIIGIALIILGLVTIAGPSLFEGDAVTPLGDALFVTAGLMWAAFTILTRRWGVKAIPATAIASVLSGLLLVPIYGIGVGFSRLASFPISVLLVQILVQGLLTGVVAVLCFTRASEYVGAARAAVFPALVPAVAILIGIPITGELPNLTQLAGLLLVTLGLLAAIGVLSGFLRR